MLFKEYNNFNFSFPSPQYLGAKHTHLPWIKQFIPKDIKSALDGFAGSQSVAFLFKQIGIKTITNDFLNFNHQIGLALIQNNCEKLTPSDVEVLMQPSSEKHNFNLMEDVFANIFFEVNEARFLDNFRANIQLLKSKNKQALAFTIMNRSMTRKVTMGHFGHTQALKYASDPERVKRNRSLIRPLEDIFKELVTEYNAAIFDNDKSNTSYNENILDLLPRLENIDLAYFDPPYCDSHADYQGFYHLLETFTEYWGDKKFINGIRRYEPQRFSGFDKKREIVSSFEKLFDNAQEIPNWLISYNDRSYPSVSELSTLISRHRDVTVEVKPYQNGRGGKGSVAGSHEVLFICKPRKRHILNKQTIELDLNERL